MTLETLANELFIDFGYFDTIYRIRAFSGLNSRFDNLLFVHFRSYHLDFRFDSNSYFDIICQENLPEIVDRIILFHLTNDGKIPNISKFFLPRGFTLDRYFSLKNTSKW
jgi:hypothetical protein